MILIQPFSYKDPLKGWPYYGQLICELNKRGIEPTVIGSEQEMFLELDGEYIDKRGKLCIVELFELVRNADKIICNESAIGHIAVCLGKSAIVLINRETPIRVIRNENTNLWRPTLREVLERL